MTAVRSGAVDSLLGLSADLGRSDSVTTAVNLALRMTEEAFDGPFALVWACDGETPTPVGATDSASETLGDRPWSPPEPLVGGLDDDWTPGEGSTEPRGAVRSRVIVPAGDRHALALYSTEPDAFGDADTAMADSIGTTLGKSLGRLDEGPAKPAVTGQTRDAAEREQQRTQIDSFRRAIEDAADGVAILDDEEYVYVDQTHVELYGFDSKADLLGDTWRRLYSEDEIERLEREAFPVLASEGHWRGRVTGTRPDGTTFPARLSLTRLDDGRLVCTVRDETERLAQQRDLALKERAMDEAGVGIHITDHRQEGDPLVYVNERFEEMTGHDSADALGRDPWSLQEPDPETLATLREAVDAGESVSVEFRTDRPDGDSSYVDLSMTPVHDDEGRIAHYIGVQRDITERKEREQEQAAAAAVFERVYEVTTDTTLSFDEKVDGLLAAGREYLDLPNGFLTRIDPDDEAAGTQTIVGADGSHELLQEGESCPLPQSYCRKTIETDGLMTLINAAETGWEGDRAHETFGLEAYIGGEVATDEGLYGTLCFASEHPREEPFTETEQSFVRLLRRWAGYEIERERARAELAEQRDRLELVLGGTGTGIAEWNLETDAVTWDDTLVEMIGRDPSSFEEFVGYIHPEDRDRVRQQLEAILETGETLNSTFRMITGEADRIWVEARVTSVHEDGQPVRVLATGTDITARKQRERERRRNERRFESLFEDPEMLVGLLDTDGTVLSANETAMEYVDVSPQTVAGEPFWEMPWWAHSETLQSDLQGWLRRAADGEYVEYSASHPGPGGETRDITGTIRPVTDADGRVTSLLVSGRDVTRREQQRRELDRLTSRFEQFAEAVPSGFYLVSPDYSETLYTNSAAAELYGVDAERLTENPESFLRHVHPDDRETIESDMATQKTDEMAGTQRQVFRVEHPDDGTRWLKSAVHPIRDETGAVDRLAGVTTDITEQRAHQRRMQSLHGATRGLLDVETPAEAFEAGVGAFKDTLEVTVAGLYRQTDDALVRATGAGLEAVDAPERVTREQTESPLWKALETGESIVYDDPGEIDDNVDRGAVGSAGYFPVGDHGVIAVGARDVSRLDSDQRQLVEVLASNLAAVLDSLEREASLRASEQRYRRLAENIPNGAVLTFDSSLTYELAAGELFSKFDLTASDFVGQAAGTVLEGSHSPLIERYRAALDGERTDRRVELGDRVVRVHIVPVPADKQRPDDTGGLVLAQDVTAEARRERELSRERERFRLLTESVDEYAFSTVGPDGSVQTWNESAERMFGYDAETAVGMSVAELHPEEESGVADRLLQQVRVAGKSAHEGEQVRADGSTFYADVRYATLGDDDEFQDYAMIARDMTERRRQRRRTELFVEESEQVVSILDTDGEISYASGSAERVLGHPSESLVGENLFDYIHPNDREKGMKRFYKLMEGDTDAVHAECRLRSGDGGWLNVEAGCRNMTSTDAIGGILVYLRDVTDRKERTRRLDAVFNGTFQFTGLLDPDGTVVEINDTALEFGGFDRESVVGEQFADVRWWTHSESVNETLRSALETAAEGEFVRYETDVRGADGLRTIDFSAKPVTDEDDEVAMLVVEGRDITEQQQSRQHMQVIHRVMRHNMRNDLNKIRAWTDLLAEEDDPERRQEKLARIKPTLTKWERMVDTIQQIRQAINARQTPEESVDAATLVSDVVATSKSKHRAATVESTVAEMGSTPVPSRLQNALQELVDNAVQASDQTEARVEVVLSRPDPDWVEIEVIDNGPGLPEMEADVLETGEETQLSHGGGLGLWMVRMLVTGAGGDIDVDVGPDGTSVCLRLPLN